MLSLLNRRIRRSLHVINGYSYALKRTLVTQNKLTPRSNAAALLNSAFL